MRGKLSSFQKMPLTTLIERVFKRINNSRFDEDELANITFETEKLKQYLNANREETIIFCVLFCLSFEQNKVDFNDIAKYIGFSSIEFLDYRKHLTQLDRKQLIKKQIERWSDANLSTTDYYVSKKVLDKIIDQQPITIHDEKVQDDAGFLELACSLVEDKGNRHFDFYEMMSRFEELIDEYYTLNIVKALKGLLLKTEDALLLIVVCKEAIDGLEYVRLNSLLDTLYDASYLKSKCRKTFLNGENLLLKKSLIEFNDQSFISASEVRITDYAQKILLGTILQVGKSKTINIINCNVINGKPLYYNAQETTQLKEFTQLLSEENFKNVAERMKNHNLSNSFCALFYGFPGTGKTETVLQIAKNTGRDIYKIDIAQYKSKWYGDSEKLVKEIFDNYNNTAKKLTLKPILLINEADAMISKRLENVNEAVDKTNNALQNIILEAMENIDGILIATTNLISNLDKAFERRFLFKIKFEKPNQETSFKIWKSKLQFLNDDIIKALIKQFEFTGGQIDNIARKCMMYDVLQGSYPNENTLMNYCKEESLQHAKPIGFSY